MLTQTLAIFFDAYRELNAKKLFWLTLILSGLVVLSIASVGVTPTGIKILVWDWSIPFINSTLFPRAFFYQLAFVNVGIGIWLTWIAAILALVSVASMIPDFIASGSIELTLSKPIGRLRLFFTKYLAGLLFVTLQVTVFTLACYLVIGIRGKSWDARVFLAVPIVVCFFSYIFSICVLFGLLTRSTIASLLLTLLFWGMLFLVNLGETTTLTIREIQLERAKSRIAQIEVMEQEARKNVWQMEEDKRAEGTEAEGNPAAARITNPPADFAPTREQLDIGNPLLPGRREQLIEDQRNARIAGHVNTGFYIAKTILPKHAETTALLDRYLVTDEQLKAFRARRSNQLEIPESQRRSDDIQIDQQKIGDRVEDIIRGRSVWWVVGSSLVFEAVILTLAGIIFVRRDF
jgi:hypothetical protein